MEQNQNRELLFISLFTLLTVIVWVSIELITTTRTSTITPQMQQLLTPLSPKIDTEVIDILSARESL